MEDVSKLKLLLHGSTSGTKSEIDKCSDDIISLINTVSSEAKGDEAVEVVLNNRIDFEVIWMACNAQFSFFPKIEDVSLTKIRVRPVFVDISVYEHNGTPIASLVLHKDFPRRKDFQKNLWDNIMPEILGQEKPEDKAE